MSWHQKLVLIYSSVNNRKQSFTGLWSVAVWYDWTILEISSCQIFAQKKPKYFIFILMDYSKNISLWVITGVSILGNFWKNLGYFIPTFGHTGPCWRWVDVDCLCTFQLGHWHIPEDFSIELMNNRREVRTEKWSRTRNEQKFLLQFSQFLFAFANSM